MTYPLRTRAPRLTAHIADIYVLQIDGVILNVDDITLHAATIARTRRLRALDRLCVWQRWILPGELIEQDLIALARALLHQRLHNETTTLLLLFVAAVSAHTEQPIRLRVQIQIVVARWAELERSRHAYSSLEVLVKVPSPLPQF